MMLFINERALPPCGLIFYFQHMYSFASCHAMSSDIDTFLPSVCSFLEKWKTQNERASKQTVNLHWNVSLLRT